jgi:hypothetical protein
MARTRPPPVLTGCFSWLGQRRVVSPQIDTIGLSYEFSTSCLTTVVLQEMDFDGPGDRGDEGHEASTAHTSDPESDLYSRTHPAVFVETVLGEQWVCQDFLPVEDEGMLIYTLRSGPEVS